MQNVLMMVASVIATMALQARVNPPRSPWQDTSSSSQDHATTHSYTCILFFNTTGFLASLSIILLFISGLPVTPNFLDFKLRKFYFIRNHKRHYYLY